MEKACPAAELHQARQTRIPSLSRYKTNGNVTHPSFRHAEIWRPQAIFWEYFGFDAPLDCVTSFMDFCCFSFPSCPNLPGLGIFSAPQHTKPLFTSYSRDVIYVDKRMSPGFQ